MLEHPMEIRESNPSRPVKLYRPSLESGLPEKQSLCSLNLIWARRVPQSWVTDRGSPVMLLACVKARVIGVGDEASR